MHGTALMLRTNYDVRGRMAQVVACLGQACEGIGRVSVVISEFIDSRSAHKPQRDDTPCIAEADTRAPTIEPDTRAPTIETDIDVPVAKVAEVTNALKLAPSIVCYCGLPVARYKIHKRTSRWYGEWFIRCPRNHRTEDQCSFFRLCGTTTMPTAGGLWLFCLQCEHFHRYDRRCVDRERPGVANMLVQVSDIGAAHLGASSIDLDEALHFEPAVGGALEFKLADSDKVLGRVEVKPDDMEAEIMVLDEHKAKAYASIKEGVETADEGCVGGLAKRLPNM